MLRDVHRVQAGVRLCPGIEDRAGPVARSAFDGDHLDGGQRLAQD